MVPDRGTDRWTAWLHSWNGTLEHGDTALGHKRQWRERVWKDADIPALLREVVPQHAEAILNMRAAVERNDMARYAALYRDGGVYADLDIEVNSATMFTRAANDKLVTLPFEKNRLVGQSLLLSPYPKHPFWLKLINWLVETYDPNCYEPTNTGPDAMTTYWNIVCLDAEYAAGGSARVRISDGFMAGPATIHHATGSWTGVANSVNHRIDSARLCPQKTFAHLNVTRCGHPKVMPRDRLLGRNTIPE